MSCRGMLWAALDAVGCVVANALLLVRSVCHVCGLVPE